MRYVGTNTTEEGFHSMLTLLKKRFLNPLTGMDALKRPRECVSEKNH